MLVWETWSLALCSPQMLLLPPLSWVRPGPDTHRAQLPGSTSVPSRRWLFSPWLETLVLSPPPSSEGKWSLIEWGSGFQTVFLGTLQGHRPSALRKLQSPSAVGRGARDQAPNARPRSFYSARSEPSPPWRTPNCSSVEQGLTLPDLPSGASAGVTAVEAVRKCTRRGHKVQECP